MLLALLLLASGQSLAVANPAGPIVTNPATMGSMGYFEAFPVSGRGTSGPCSTTAPTGFLLGAPVALSFARASTATCTKTASGGLATTGIADGDLVILSSNVPRVEFSDGVLGPLKEAAKTNSCLRSEQIDDAAWISFATGVANPTVTANATASSPLAVPGSLPERLQIPAVTTAQNSIRFQSPVTTNGVVSTCSAFVLGNTSSGTTDICLQQAAGYTCSPCAYVSTSWNRCVVTGTAGGALQCFIGNAGSLNTPATARGAADIFVTGFQAEAGAYATSYIPTGISTAARAADGPLTASGVALAPPWCMGANLTALSAVTAFNERGLIEYADQWGLGTGGPNQARVNRAFVGGVSSGITTAPPARYSVSRNAAGTEVTLCNNGTCAAPAALAGATAATGTIQIGVADNSFSQPSAEGILTRVKVDLSETGCRQ